MHLRRKKTVSHINRIIGQLTTLKKYIIEGRKCEDIASLTTSITKSCESLRMRTLEGFIMHDINEGKLSNIKIERLHTVMKRYKK